MAGTKEGGKKAAAVNREKRGKDYYSTIAKHTWDDPDRNRVVGFAAMSEERRKEVAQKGVEARKNKNET